MGEEPGEKKREEEKERDTGRERRVPLIDTHMSRDLISRYLRSYLPFHPTFPCTHLLRSSSPTPYLGLPSGRKPDNVIERNADRIGLQVKSTNAISVGHGR